MRHTRAACIAALMFALSACAAAPAPPSPPPVAAPSDPDGFLYFNDAATYRSAMRRCAARLPAYEDAKARAESTYVDAAARYRSKGGDPDRADLARIFARSDRELAAEIARQSPTEREAGCARLADYHARTTRAYLVQ